MSQVSLEDAYAAACRALGEARVELDFMEREITRNASVHAQMQAEIEDHRATCRDNAGRLLAAQKESDDSVIWVTPSGRSGRSGRTHEGYGSFAVSVIDGQVNICAEMEYEVMLTRADVEQIRDGLDRWLCASDVE